MASNRKRDIEGNIVAILLAALLVSVTSQSTSSRAGVQESTSAWQLATNVTFTYLDSNPSELDNALQIMAGVISPALENIVAVYLDDPQADATTTAAAIGTDVNTALSAIPPSSDFTGLDVDSIQGEIQVTVSNVLSGVSESSILEIVQVDVINSVLSAIGNGLAELNGEDFTFQVTVETLDQLQSTAGAIVTTATASVPSTMPPPVTPPPPPPMPTPPPPTVSATIIEEPVIEVSTKETEAGAPPFSLDISVKSDLESGDAQAVIQYIEDLLEDGQESNVVQFFLLTTKDSTLNSSLVLVVEALFEDSQITASQLATVLGSTFSNNPEFRVVLGEAILRVQRSQQLTGLVDLLSIALTQPSLAQDAFLSALDYAIAKAGCGGVLDVLLNVREIIAAGGQNDLLEEASSNQSTVFDCFEEASAGQVISKISDDISSFKIDDAYAGLVAVDSADQISVAEQVLMTALEQREQSQLVQLFAQILKGSSLPVPVRASIVNEFVSMGDEDAISIIVDSMIEDDTIGVELEYTISYALTEANSNIANTFVEVITNSVSRSGCPLSDIIANILNDVVDEQQQFLVEALVQGGAQICLPPSFQAAPVDATTPIEVPSPEDTSVVEPEAVDVTGIEPVDVTVESEAATTPIEVPSPEVTSMVQPEAVDVTGIEPVDITGIPEETEIVAIPIEVPVPEDISVVNEPEVVDDVTGVVPIDVTDISEEPAPIVDTSVTEVKEGIVAIPEPEVEAGQLVLAPIPEPETEVTVGLPSVAVDPVQPITYSGPYESSEAEEAATVQDAVNVVTLQDATIPSPETSFDALIPSIKMESPVLPDSQQEYMSTTSLIDVVDSPAPTVEAAPLSSFGPMTSDPTAPISIATGDGEEFYVPPAVPIPSSAFAANIDPTAPMGAVIQQAEEEEQQQETLTVSEPEPEEVGFSSLLNMPQRLSQASLYSQLGSQTSEDIIAEPFVAPSPESVTTVSTTVVDNVVSDMEVAAPSPEIATGEPSLQAVVDAGDERVATPSREIVAVEMIPEVVDASDEQLATPSPETTSVEMIPEVVDAGDEQLATPSPEIATVEPSPEAVEAVAEPSPRRRRPARGQQTPVFTGQSIGYDDISNMLMQTLSLPSPVIQSTPPETQPEPEALPSPSLDDSTMQQMPPVVVSDDSVQVPPAVAMMDDMLSPPALELPTISNISPLPDVAGSIVPQVSAPVEELPTISSISPLTSIAAPTPSIVSQVVQAANTASVVTPAVSTAGSISSSTEECTDIPPDNVYTCPEQLEFGKCARQWMQLGNFCAKTCGFCPKDCTNIQPTDQFTCEQHKEQDECEEAFILEGDYCRSSCGRCDAAIVAASQIEATTSQRKSQISDVADDLDVSSNCTDTLPTGSKYTCEEQEAFGKCESEWMINGGYCELSCGKCSQMM